MSNLNPYDVARTYWTLPLQDRNWSRVASELKLDDPDSKVVQNRLGRLARSWEENGLVRHVVIKQEPDGDNLPRLPDLEQKLRRAFALRDAIVVDFLTVARSQGASPPSEGAVGDQQRDNDLHEALGRWGARVFLSIARHNDIVGVGGGRGPFFTAENCRFRSGLPRPNEIVSLTGNMAANVWGDTKRLWNVASMDADFVVSRLGAVLGATNQAQLKSPIACGDSANPRTLKGGGTPSGKGSRDKRVRPQRKPAIAIEKVNLALVGIGALAGGHRLQFYDDTEELYLVREELRALWKLVRDIDAQVADKDGVPYHIAGDICNRLIINDLAGHHIPEWKVDEPKRQKLAEMVRNLNDRFLSPEESEFAKICERGAVIAVAGGRHKVGAIYQVLAQRKPWITHLVTDSFVAENILAWDLASSAGAAVTPPA